MGTNEELPEKITGYEYLESAFPCLDSDGYVVTSLSNSQYNCIAHAAGDNTKRWDPTDFPKPGFYWPIGVPLEEGIDALVKVFESLGYDRCIGGELEPGWEKIALYADNYGMWQHAAKQLCDGSWSSKLGELEDIKHPHPHSVSGPAYGKVVIYMKRARESSQET